MIKNKYLVVILVMLFTFLTFSMVNANENFINFTEKVSYEYEFTQKYVVAGERVLNIEFHNGSEHYIKALEFEILLKSPFGDEISDWNSFMHPEFKLESGETKSLTLSLTKRNVMGVEVNNILDNASDIKLRYKRILLDDGTVIEKNDIYPELENVYGNYEVEISLLNNNENQPDINKTYNFEPTDKNEESTAWSLHQDKYGLAARYTGYETLNEVIDIFEEDCILLWFEIKNISNTALKNRWGERDIEIIMTDNKNNQYNNYGILFEPQSTSDIARSREKLQPDSLVKFLMVFDKKNGYEPEWIKVYINENEYYEKLEFQKSN